MKLIIDIPEDFYVACKEWVDDECANIEQTIIAEGVPVPQGEWKVYGRQGGIPITDYCTNCKYEMMWYRNKYNYCPNCGAKMLNQADVE